MHPAAWNWFWRQKDNERGIFPDFLLWFVEPSGFQRGTLWYRDCITPCIHRRRACISGSDFRYLRNTYIPYWNTYRVPTKYLHVSWKYRHNTYTLPTEHLQLASTLDTPLGTTDESGERTRNLLRGREALAGCRGAAMTNLLSITPGRVRC